MFALNTLTCEIDRPQTDSNRLKIFHRICVVFQRIGSSSKLTLAIGDKWFNNRFDRIFNVWIDLKPERTKQSSAWLCGHRLLFSKLIDFIFTHYHESKSIHFFVFDAHFLHSFCICELAIRHCIDLFQSLYLARIVCFASITLITFRKQKTRKLSKEQLK